MLKKGKLRTYFNTQWDRMLNHLDGFTHATEAEELHHMRVAIKKINAFFYFLDVSHHSSVLKGLKPIKNLFQQAGEIRGIDMTLHFCTARLPHHAAVGKRLEHMRLEKVNQLIFKTKKMKKNLARAKKDLQKEIKSVPFRQLKKRMARELHRADIVFSDLSDIKDLHPTRKIIKRIIYIYAVLNPPSQEKLALNVRYLQHLEDVIGRWHDRLQIIEMLKAGGMVESAVMDTFDHEAETQLSACKNEFRDFMRKATHPAA